MVAVPYSVDPNTFRYHYGAALPAFKGSRMQYGRGFGSMLKRVALPLLSKGARFLAPHLKNAAKGIASDLIGNFMKKGAMAPMPPRSKLHKKRKASTKTHSKKKKTKRSTSDIF